MAHETLAPWGEVVWNAPSPLTATDLLAMPDAARGHELVEGRLVRMPPTGIEHSDIVGNLYTAIRQYVGAHALGTVTMPETGFILSQPGAADTVLAPDVGFIAAGRLAAPGSAERKKYGRLAPDLVVEVASPDQSRSEMAAKMQRWPAAGVRLGWLVWPSARQIDVWRQGGDAPLAVLTANDALDGLDVLPGFTFPVAGVFA